MKRFLIITVVSNVLLSLFSANAQSINGHEYVDLGLSVLWATCNIGADKPSDPGVSYYWGDTKPARRTFKFSEIKYFIDDEGKHFSKYVTKSENGSVDNLTTLELSDDAARKKWGGSWRMPTKAECEELITKCKWKKWELGSKKGYWVTGPNGNTLTLFLGELWTSSLYPSDPAFVYALLISSYSQSVGREPRRKYHSIRPVSDKNVSASGTTSTQNAKGHEYVDLGLSVKWATCNLGASRPEEFGDYYAWGETHVKNEYSWKTYKWCDGTQDGITKYKSDASHEDVIIYLEPSDDAAHVSWGGKWRIPTKKEQDELRKKCTWIWTKLNGVNGYKVVSNINGNSIFLPAAGFRFDNEKRTQGEFGGYWSSSRSSTYSDDSYDLVFASDFVDYGFPARCGGESIRPVIE